MGKPTLTISFRFLLQGGGKRWIGYYQTEYIGLVKRTRGTETSQYLEEKTSTEIPVVVASEPGPDRKSVVKGKSVSVRVDLGGRRIIQKKNTKTTDIDRDRKQQK